MLSRIKRWRIPRRSFSSRKSLSTELRVSSSVTSHHSSHCSLISWLSLIPSTILQSFSSINSRDSRFNLICYSSGAGGGGWFIPFPCATSCYETFYSIFDLDFPVFLSISGNAFLSLSPLEEGFGDPVLINFEWSESILSWCEAVGVCAIPNRSFEISGILNGVFYPLF